MMTGQGNRPESSQDPTLLSWIIQSYSPEHPPVSRKEEDVLPALKTNLRT